MANRPVSGTAKPPKLPPHQQPLAPPPPIDTGFDRPGDRPVQVRDTNPWGPGTEPGGPGSHVGQYDNSGTTPPGPDPSLDWAKAFFGALGLPDDVMNSVTTILRDHAQDQTLAQALATQYIRSTSWYQIHYPGALEGIAKGVIGSEADYASYLNQVNVLSRQYQGRDVSGDEIKGYLQAGYDPSYVGKLYGGQAWVAANKNDVNYTLGAFGDGQPGQQGLTALGNENAGLDSAVGQKLQTQLQQATARLHAIFRGTLATPSLTLGANGLQAPSLAGARQPNDVGT